MISIDLEQGLITVVEQGNQKTLPLASREAFEIISQIWLRAGWDAKYVYSFTWLGRPIIQLPDDLVRIQEVIYQLKPDVIVETGIAHGGSLIFYAGLCKMMDHGRVIGIDIEIRPHNRTAIENHPLYEFITMIEGSSIEPKVVNSVKSLIKPDEKVFVMLDSNHSKSHVLQELEMYSELVSVGSYIVAADGIMATLGNAPRTGADWDWNNPKEAAEEFQRNHPNFVIEEPAFLFNEGIAEKWVTYWPSAFLHRIS